MSGRGQPVEYFDRDTRAIETEAIYGERWLRFAYENPVGRLAVAALVRRAFFSRRYGRRMDRPSSRDKIAPFLERYGVDAAEFEKAPDAFESFNDFFRRKLKPAARPIDPDPATIVFPSDGRHLLIPDLSLSTGLYVKGQRLKLDALLGGRVPAGEFTTGAAVISRLCPSDYHRFHAPFAGATSDPIIIDGPLYSVNPISLRRNIAHLVGNRKTILPLTHPVIGRALFIPVGATNVGSIRLTCRPDDAIAKGEEIGYFEFGGSTVITLFPANAVTFAADLVEQSAQHREVYARMGTPMATLLSS